MRAHHALAWVVVTLTACSREVGGSVEQSPTPAVVRERPAATALPTPAWFTPTPLRSIPEGSFTPLFRGKGGSDRFTVAPFAIEESPVTNAQFVAFLNANPRWRRSQVPEVFAQAGYLVDWRGDLLPPEGVDDPSLDDRPVTTVTWFAARAYARWLGRRLPTVAEWERVAAASETEEDAVDEPAFAARILEWYSNPRRDAQATIRSTFANVFGVWDLHGLVWEWTDDFNSALVTGESRGDGSLERNLFCGAGATGAADPTDYAAFMRSAFRSSMRGNYAVRNVGFRCAADAAIGTPPETDR